MFWKVIYFVRDFYKKHGSFESVLDVGSRNINGSVKDAFNESGVAFPSRFVGIDLVEGPDVDIVMNAHDLLKHFSPESFDLITCCETLEHDLKFWETVENMKILLKPGGWLVVTAPGLYFFHHDFPSDYYRFTPEAFKDFIFDGFEEVYVEQYTDIHDKKAKANTTVLGFGRKPV